MPENVANNNLRRNWTVKVMVEPTKAASGAGGGEVEVEGEPDDSVSPGAPLFFFSFFFSFFSFFSFRLARLAAIFASEIGFVLLRCCVDSQSCLNEYTES